jgi:hypothetical protein
LRGPRAEAVAFADSNRDGTSSGTEAEIFGRRLDGPPQLTPPQ